MIPNEFPTRSKHKFQYVGPSAWRNFRVEWIPTERIHTLASRVTGRNGRSQPTRLASSSRSHDEVIDHESRWNIEGSSNNTYLSYAIELFVEASNDTIRRMTNETHNPEFELIVHE